MSRFTVDEDAPMSCWLVDKNERPIRRMAGFTVTDLQADPQGEQPDAMGGPSGAGGGPPRRGAGQPAASASSEAEDLGKSAISSQGVGGVAGTRAGSKARASRR